MNRQHTDRPLIGVAAIVIRNGKVLLGRRKNSHGDGCWQFPGGHLEYGETIQDCAIREVREETGMVVWSPRLGPYTNDVFEQEDKHYVTLYVICRHNSGKPAVKEPEKCDRWDWFDWENLPQPPFLPIRNLLRHGFDIRHWQFR